MTVTEADGQRLIRMVLAGDKAAAEQFFGRIADTVWTSCRRLTRSEAEARNAYAAVLTAFSANGFSRLRAYDGRSRLETFVAVSAREILATDLLRALQEDAHRAWGAFEAMFRADFQALIRRRLPGPPYEETRRDAYQDVCLAFIADDYRRLRAYGGIGSFSGFILHTADRLLLDFIRSFSGRRRMPAAIARLTALEQDVFRAVFWEGTASEPAAIAQRLAGKMAEPPAADTVAAALERVRAVLPAGFLAALPASPKFVALEDAPELEKENPGAGLSSASPEEDFIKAEAEALLSRAAAALSEIAATLPEADRLYLQIALSGGEVLPAREVARLMQKPVEEVYKLKQRLLKQLKAMLNDHEGVKKWRTSV
jgi:RNA polymerase primary sigma factor